MPGLTGILDIGKQALLTQQLALQVTSNNISNVNTPGYSRQRGALQERLPVQTEAGPIGTGVQMTSVEAARDQFLEARLSSVIQTTGKEATVTGYLNQVQSVFGLSQAGVGDALSRFFNSFSSLANDPTSAPLRYGVISAAKNLAVMFNDATKQLSDIQQNADTAVIDSVNQINNLSAKIAALNVQINNTEAAGVHANDLRDQRMEAVKELSSLADIHYYETSDGTFSISSAGTTLVTADFHENLSLTRSGPMGFNQVIVNGRDITASIQNGRLGGLLQVRDSLVPNYQSDLDTLAESVIGEVNAVHQGGKDLQSPPSAATLSFFTPVAGVAGAAQAFAVNPAVAADPRFVAAGQSGAPGDNANALALADLASQRLMASGTQSFTDAITAMQARIGTDARSSEIETDTNNAIKTQLENSRDQISGVSLDEEAIDLMRFQKAYQAAAKLINVVNQLMDDVLNIAR